MEEFPQLREVVERGFNNPADVDLVSLIELHERIVFDSFYINV